MHPTRKEYSELARRYDIVPVYAEFLADAETPVSVLARFADRPNVFLLESMEGGEKWGRYSFVGVDPELFLEEDHSRGRTGCFEKLRSAYKGQRVAEIPGLPRFIGGVVGFIGYEGICEFERMPLPKSGEPRPVSRFLNAERLIVFDNVRHTVKIVICTRPAGFASSDDAYMAASDAIDSIVRKLEAPAPDLSAPATGIPEFHSNMAPDRFRAMVARAKEYIEAGDVIQVVLSQCFRARCDVSPVHLYRALRFLNPSPYTFFFKAGGHVLAGSSPEVMVRLTGRLVEVRPIAGTRPRGATEQEDRALADQLLSDEKEKAEHVMLVDLGRNDVGRVCEPGSVQVTESMVIERYSHVMHMVSHVQGMLRDGLDAYDVIKATFPAGTLTGAPKIRAMEIIHELEPGPRGAYGGAVGYIGHNGNMDLAITIRTLDISDGTVAVQAGAGVVYDSDPQREYEETCHKARAMQQAVAMAARGLELA